MGNGDPSVILLKFEIPQKTLWIDKRAWTVTVHTPLTKREEQILQLPVEGLSNHQRDRAEAVLTVADGEELRPPDSPEAGPPQSPRRDQLPPIRETRAVTVPTTGNAA